MKNKKEIIAELITLIILLIMVGCSFLFTSCKEYEYNNTVQTETMMNYERIYNKIQLDSVLNVEGLPLNINDWLKAAYVDYETNTPITQYFYYKTNDYNEVTEIYKIMYNVNTDTLYNYSKTIINTIY